MALILTFDTEDYGRKVNNIIEKKKCADISFIAVSEIIELLKKYNTKATFFMLGKLIENQPKFKQLFTKKQNLAHIEIASHTYSHSKLEIFNKQPPKNRPIITIKELNYEIIKTNNLIKKNYNIKPKSLRLPYCYIGGVNNQKDKKTLIKIFKSNNLEYISTQRTSKFGTKTPFTKDSLQPYKISKKLIEIPINGLFDTQFYNENNNSISKKIKKTKKIFKLKKIKQLFIQELKTAIKYNLHYIPAFHPWCIFRLDHKLEILESLIKTSKDKNFKIIKASELNNEQI